MSLTHTSQVHGGTDPYIRHWDVEQDFERMFDQEPTSLISPPHDAEIAKPFASAIDDIMKGRRQGKRNRGKVRLERTRSRGERSKSRSEKASVSCEKCGATFACVGNLNRHKRVSHQGIRVYCDFPDCQQSFSQTADLSRHQRRVHMYVPSSQKKDQGKHP